MSETGNRDRDNFIMGLERAIAPDRPECETVAEVKEIVTEALARRGWLPQRCLAPEEGCYARHLVYKDPRDRFAIVAMVWSVGQATPIHDHGGVWCVEGVYEGSIRVTRFDLEDTEEPDAARFHQNEVLIAEMGATGALIPPVEHHRIDNPFDRPAVTVHTYGGDLKACRIYLPRADGLYEIRTKTLGYTTEPAPPSGAGAHRA